MEFSGMKPADLLTPRIFQSAFYLPAIRLILVILAALAVVGIAIALLVALVSQLGMNNQPRRVEAPANTLTPTLALPEEQRDETIRQYLGGPEILANTVVASRFPVNAIEIDQPDVTP